MQSLWRIRRNKLFNENLLNQIIKIRKTIMIVGNSNRLSDQLEILRYVRNNTLGISFDEGLIEEDKLMGNKK